MKFIQQKQQVSITIFWIATNTNIYTPHLYIYPKNNKYMQQSIKNNIMKTIYLSGKISGLPEDQVKGNLPMQRSR